MKILLAPYCIIFGWLHSFVGWKASLVVLTESYLERPLGFPDVGLMAFLTGDLVDHFSLPLLWSVGLDLHQGLSEGPHWLESCLDPKASAYPLQLLT